MAESDSARDYLIYGVEALNIYFQDRDDVYVSFIQVTSFYLVAKCLLYLLNKYRFVKFPKLFF